MEQTPSFDTWTSGFLLAVAMGIFLFLILIVSNSKRNYPIALLILSFSSILFSYVMYWTKYNVPFPYFNSFQYLGYFAIGPLLYNYTLNLYNKKITFFYLHYALAFLSIGITLLVWSKYMFNYKLHLVGISKFLSSYILIAVHLIVYLLLTQQVIKKFNPIETEFQKIRHKWITILLSLYGLFIFSYISYYILINFSFFNTEWDYMISITMSITIYTIGYFAYKEPQIFNGEFFSKVFLPIKNKSDSFEDNLINEFYDNLVHYIEREKPFKDNELRLANLADQVGYSTHLLSKVINKKSKKNFNSFINDYRLKEAEKLLVANNKGYSIKTIYFDVGFNNKVTFYNAFKAKYQCTPTEFKRSKQL